MTRPERDILVGVLVGRAGGESCGERDYTSLYTDVRDPLIYNWLKGKVKEVEYPGSVLYHSFDLMLYGIFEFRK